MFESGKNEAVLRKSYEISYALWRIAANIRKRRFANILSGKAIQLLCFAADGDKAAMESLLSTLELLIKFGVDVGIIGIGNGEMIFAEIGNLKAAIPEPEIAGKESGNNNGNNEVYLGDIFAGSEPIELDAFLEDNGVKREVNYENGNSSNNQKSEIRQSAILERIRQIGNCRLGDLLGVFPDVSERTIRYDLEALVQKGLVTRLGTGGRSAYYQVADNPTYPQ